MHTYVTALFTHCKDERHPWVLLLYFPAFLKSMVYAQFGSYDNGNKKYLFPGLFLWGYLKYTNCLQHRSSSTFEYNVNSSMPTMGRCAPTLLPRQINCERVPWHECSPLQLSQAASGPVQVAGFCQEPHPSSNLLAGTQHRPSQSTSVDAGCSTPAGLPAWDHSQACLIN